MSNTAAYWEDRYASGRSSGAGSEGAEGHYKAEFVSQFIADHGITPVTDWGCGDGQVLHQMNLHGADYTGYDVSKTALSKLRDEFPEHRFVSYPAVGPVLPCELSLSLDVMFHLPDRNEYSQYVWDVFDAATRYVLVYSTDYNAPFTGNHVRRRNFTEDVARWCPGWSLVSVAAPFRDAPDAAQFFVYRKASDEHRSEIDDGLYG